MKLSLGVCSVMLVGAPLVSSACSVDVMPDASSVDQSALTTYERRLVLDFCNDGVPAGARCRAKPSGQGCDLDPDRKPTVPSSFELLPFQSCATSTLPDGERTVRGLQPQPRFEAAPCKSWSCKMHITPSSTQSFLQALDPQEGVTIRPDFQRPIPDFKPGQPCSFTWREDAETLGGSASCSPYGSRYVLNDTFRIHAKEKTVLLRKTGHFEDVRHGKVQAVVDYRVDPPSPNAVGQVILGLQELTQSGQWIEVAREYSNRTQDGVQSVSATFAPNTTFRLEVWTGELGIDEVDVGFRSVSISVPECIPDVTRPGECL